MTESSREISWKSAGQNQSIEIETENAKSYRQKRNFQLGENVYDTTKKSGICGFKKHSRF